MSDNSCLLILQIFPMMRLDELFILNSQLLALQQDGPSSHPLTKENLTSQDDISDMFDVITYDKGTSHSLTLLTLHLKILSSYRGLAFQEPPSYI